MNKDLSDYYWLLIYDLGIVENFEYRELLIDISGVLSLKGYKIDQNLLLGANVSLQDTIEIFKEISQTRIEFVHLAQVVKHLELVANLPVRKVGYLIKNKLNLLIILLYR